MTRVEIEAKQDQFGSTQDQILVASDRARGEARRFVLDRRSISSREALLHLAAGDAVRRVSRSRLPIAADDRGVAAWRPWSWPRRIAKARPDAAAGISSDSGAR